MLEGLRNRGLMGPEGMSKLTGCVHCRRTGREQLWSQCEHIWPSFHTCHNKACMLTNCWFVQVRLKMSPFEIQSVRTFKHTHQQIVSASTDILPVSCRGILSQQFTQMQVLLKGADHSSVTAAFYQFRGLHIKPEEAAPVSTARTAGRTQSSFLNLLHEADPANHTIYC